MEYNKVYTSSWGYKFYIDENGVEHDNSDEEYERMVDDMMAQQEE